MKINLIKSEDQMILLFRNYLKKNGKTQEWLANKLGYHVSTINSWLCKRTRIRLDEVIEICNVLGFEIYYSKKVKEEDKNEK